MPLLARTPVRCAVILAGAAMLLAGCEQNNTSFFIQGHILPTAGDMGGCELEPDQDSTMAPNGVFNVQRGTQYKLFPLYVNQIRPREPELSADKAGIHVERAEIELRDTNGEPLSFGDGLPNPFTQPTATFVPSASMDGQPSRAAGAIPVIPNSYRQALADMGVTNTTILVTVRAFGETLGDNSVSTEEWTWPVDLCSGCLFVCPSTLDTETQPCVIGQDVLVPDPTLPRCSAGDMSGM